MRPAPRGATHWRRFVRRYGRQIRFTADSALAKWNLGPHELEDVVSHVYEKLIEDNYRRLRAWEGRSSFSTFLALVTRNLSLDYVKLHNKGHRVEHDGKLEEWVERMPVYAELDENQLMDLREAIQSLSPKQAMIMRLRLQGKSLRDIATIMNLPHGSVFGENARALDSLRTVFETGSALEQEEGEKEL